MALAALTMHEPRLLLFDEPTAGVDPQARRDFWDEIHHLTTNKGVTALVSTHYMDEAERCDKIVYLANGEKLTEGTVQRIIADSGLTTFRAEGEGVRQMATALEHCAGVEHVAYFGSALHVSGRDRDLVAQAIAEAGSEQVDWQEVRPTLEDAFIALTERAGIDPRYAA